MEPMSRSERAALCNSALEAGADAPTLCGGWTVKDLVIHLLVRERDPLGAPGIVVPRLEGLTRFSERRLAQQDFSVLVERVRSGPPKWSPMALPPLDRSLNTLEYFVHHEDIRRAHTSWRPRELTESEQKALWKMLTVAGRGLVRHVGVPVEMEWKGRTAVLSKGSKETRGGRPAVVSGPPAELTMFLFGRDRTAGLRFRGPKDSVAALRRGDKGL